LFDVVFIFVNYFHSFEVLAVVDCLEALFEHAVLFKQQLVLVHGDATSLVTMVLS
jgi:hypothetical protein